VIVEPKDAGVVVEAARLAGIAAWIAGEVIPGSGSVRLDTR
jgi:hypothetical protein